MKKWTTIAQSTATLATFIAGGCAFKDPPPFEPRQIAEIQRTAASEVPIRPAPAIPTTHPSLIRRTTDNGEIIRPATRPTPPEAPTIRLTLQEILHRAVMNSVDVRVAGYQPAVDEARVIEAEARFDPTLFVQPQFSRTFPQFGPSRRPGATGDITEVLTESLQAGIRKELESGGQIEIRSQMNRVDVENRGALIDEGPFHDSELIFQITQPILRNFGAEVNRARITISRGEQRISELDWRERLERTLTEIEQAYWELQRAIREVEIQENLLRQAEDTLDRLNKRAGHDVSRVELSRSLASVEFRASALVRLRSRVHDLSDQIKRLVSDPDLPTTGGVLIVPADAPLQQLIEFSLSDQVETALQNRLELMQQKIRIDNASTVVKAAESNVLPQLNLIFSTSLLGFDEEFKESVKNQFDADLVTYSLGFAFEVPIGNRQARAIYQRTLLQRQLNIEQYRQAVEEVVRDVKLAHREVQTTQEEMAAATFARLAAEEALATIERQEENVRLDANFLERKLARQEELARARSAEVQAIANYNIAISALERAKGTILKYNNVNYKEAPGPAFSKWDPYPHLGQKR